MEAYLRAMVLPTVLFTKRKKWRKDVVREIKSELAGRSYLHFEYQLVRLFDFNARDYYESQNPVVKILMPRMNYTFEERTEVIRQAYLGLYQLVTPLLFDKYIDFIDVYAGVQEEEREALTRAIEEKEETAMLAQYIREKGYQEGLNRGLEQGMERGIEQGIVDGLIEGIELGIGLRFGPDGMRLMDRIRRIRKVEKLKEIKEAVRNTLDLNEFEAVLGKEQVH